MGGGIATVRACVLAVLAACTVDAPDDSFGMITAGPVGPTAGSPTGGGGDDDGSGSETEDDGDDDGGGSADSAAGSGSGAAESDGGTAGDTGGGAGAQPADGVYSACATAAECVGATYCIPANAGFCTRDCVAPGDCPPSPNGAAPTVCIPVTMPVATSVCALDCSGGQACPAPMTCTAVEGTMVCV
jgi:hypothetical protein